MHFVSQLLLQSHHLLVNINSFVFIPILCHRKCTFPASHRFLSSSPGLDRLSTTRQTGSSWERRQFTPAVPHTAPSSKHHFNTIGPFPPHLGIHWTLLWSIHNIILAVSVEQSNTADQSMPPVRNALEKFLFSRLASLAPLPHHHPTPTTLLNLHNNTNNQTRQSHFYCFAAKTISHPPCPHTPHPSSLAYSLLRRNPFGVNMITIHHTGFVLVG